MSEGLGLGRGTEKRTFYVGYLSNNEQQKILAPLESIMTQTLYGIALNTCIEDHASLLVTDTYS